jgi:hypothetical protein
VSGFLLDENVAPALQAALRRYAPGIIVYRVGEAPAPPLHTRDPEILIWIEEHDCILLTYNRSSMPVHLQDHLAAGRHILGIVQLDQLMAMGALINDILLIWGAGLPGEYADQIIYLPLQY